MSKSKVKKPSKMKLRKGDEVIVIAGKSKGQRGTILSVLPTVERVVVDGVNLATKAIRPNPQLNIEGGLVTKPMSLHASNVAILNPETQKGDRIAYALDAAGLKTRVYRSNGKPIEYTTHGDK